MTDTPEKYHAAVMAQAQERRARALKLRAEGKTYQAIGAELGISRQAAHVLVQRAKINAEAT